MQIRSVLPFFSSTSSRVSRNAPSEMGLGGRRCLSLISIRRIGGIKKCAALDPVIVVLFTCSLKNWQRNHLFFIPRSHHVNTKEFVERVKEVLQTSADGVVIENHRVFVESPSRGQLRLSCATTVPCSVEKCTGSLQSSPQDLQNLLTSRLSWIPDCHCASLVFKIFRSAGFPTDSI